MNTMNLSSVKPSISHLPFNFQRPSLSKSFSSLSFRIAPPLSNFSRCAIKASVQSSSLKNPENTVNFSKFDALMEKLTSGIPLNTLLNPLKATLVTSVAAAAIFFTRFSFPLKPAMAASTAPPVVEMKESVSEEEREKSLEERLLSNPNDVDGLKSLMEIKIKGKKLPEAIEILGRLAELEPEEVEWPMMRAHLYAYNEEFTLAKKGFNQLLEKNPFRVEAYHGLVTVASQEESSDDLANVEKRVQEAIKLCKKENKRSDLRDFKLLLAQIRVLEGKYDDALKFYQDLVKEEPRDFRPYLCQGIIYTLLRKNSEAEKNFEKYRRLVPKGHPYARYFDDNMMATKLFAEKVENERAMAKS